MFSVPDILSTLAGHMCQRTANDRTGLAKTHLQAVVHVELACVNLNDLSIQLWNLSHKVTQNS